MEKYPMNLRRLRANTHIRELASDVRLSHKQFIQPIFVSETAAKSKPSDSLSQVNIESEASVLKSIEKDLTADVNKFLFFPIPEKSKDALNFDFGCKTIQAIKENFGDDIWLASDLCLCSYTSHGHCGHLNEDCTKVDNNLSVESLANYAYQIALAGADCIAPSDMMDGRIQAIRSTLDQHGLDDVSIMAYSAKFASSFYGPFRDVCDSSPDKKIKLKDRKTYQLDPANKKSALQAAWRDQEDGADILMVKPAINYLDIINELSHAVSVPLAAYHVSGEYQSIELMAQHGLMERKDGHVEVWNSIVRAGADIIISYAARKAKEWLNN